MNGSFLARYRYCLIVCMGLLHKLRDDGLGLAMLFVKGTNLAKEAYTTCSSYCKK